MTKEKSQDPLLEWNRLNIDNAEQSFISAMFQSLSENSPVLDKYSLWLLVGTGATGALLITQIKSILPYLTEAGFRLCLITLACAAIAGFVAKFFAIRCNIQNNVQVRIGQLSQQILSKHGEDEDQILKAAKERGLELQTDLDLSKVIEEFCKPFPNWLQWLIRRKLKNSNQRQGSYHMAALSFLSQSIWTFIQSVLYLVFMLFAAFFASAI